jgi:hypothetical protein
MNTSDVQPSVNWQEVPCDLMKTRHSRRVWRRLYGDPGSLWVLHHCNEELCREPTHLYLGTASDNNRKAYLEGRRKKFRGPSSASELYRGKRLRCTGCGSIVRRQPASAPVDQHVYHRSCLPS